MSGVVLAVFVFTLVFVAHLAFSHVARPARKERTLVRFMLAAIAIDIVVYPVARRILIPLIEPSPLPLVVDLGAGLAAMGLLVLGYVEFWSIVERSFSLRLLIDVAESSDGLTRDEIETRYSGGRGLEWLMEKRVSDLVGSGMIQRTGARLDVTRRGRLVGAFFRVPRRAFLMR